mmetsp:Transcript_761/g.2911  ORF Transcript_761/g.2911 Transcript_761/m.2911 type:complete len:311 (-) Transcript_761:1582-2514(-)
MPTTLAVPAAMRCKSRPRCLAPSAILGSRLGLADPTPSCPMSFLPNEYANAPMSAFAIFGTKKLVVRNSPGIEPATSGRLCNPPTTVRLTFHQSTVCSAFAPNQSSPGKIGRNPQNGNRVNRDAFAFKAWRTKMSAVLKVRLANPASSTTPYFSERNGNPALVEGGVYARSNSDPVGTSFAMPTSYPASSLLISSRQPCGIAGHSLADASPAPRSGVVLATPRRTHSATIRCNSDCGDSYVPYNAGCATELPKLVDSLALPKLVLLCEVEKAETSSASKVTSSAYAAPASPKISVTDVSKSADVKTNAES